MKFEAIQQAVPQSVSWAVIIQGPALSFLAVLNPILQAVSLLIAIVWGCIQIHGWLKKRKK
jgi:hypothetical protein